MNKYNYDKFTELILKVTKLKNVDEALYFLARKGNVGRPHMYKIDNAKFADSILYCLKAVEYDKKSYDRNVVTDYLNKYFKNRSGLVEIMKPIIDETKIMVENCLKKYEDYIVSEFTEKQVKEIFINRVIWTKVEYSDYCFDNLNLIKSKAIHSTYAYNILIDKYNCKFNTRMGKASERTQKKMELVNEKFDYKLKEIILYLQPNHKKKFIAEYLNIPASLYRSILKNMDLMRGHKQIEQSEIDSLKLLDNENEIIKINIEITESEINEVEPLRMEMYENLSVKEGIRKQCIHYKIERNPKIAELSKKYFMQKYGALFCECCEKNYEDKYGELGKGYIEAHHENPLGENEGAVETKIKDFRMVCSNCHSMLHRKMPCLKVEELKKIIIETEKR
ncbi:hypothetical protein [Clostridium sp. CF012]|uniref:HNH endonuclease n=1 Tax=Clostridium sp. CF012 TaxID=2843319 RepID=UPI001C0E093E|nr:hypothetical protein [Clostridium sp. CF012]MBU3145021.1 hypothetical protein [Clostridium sp. CF012]